MQEARCGCVGAYTEDLSCGLDGKFGYSAGPDRGNVACHSSFTAGCQAGTFERCNDVLPGLFGEAGGFVRRTDKVPFRPAPAGNDSFFSQSDWWSVFYCCHVAAYLAVWRRTFLISGQRCRGNRAQFRTAAGSCSFTQVCLHALPVAAAGSLRAGNGNGYWHTSQSDTAGT